MAGTKRTSQQISEEIAKLQTEMEKALAAEKADVVAKIKVAVAHYGITAAEIGLAPVGGKGKRAAKAQGNAKPKVPAKDKPAPRVKYKDDAGNAWSGYGPKPKWFVDALAAGKTADELRA